MPRVSYEELQGSPTIKMNREGGGAQRTLLVAWGDIGRAILEVFPGAAFGYPYTASFPGFPWLRAQEMNIEPWNPENPTGNGFHINTYPNGAKITVDYAPNKFEEDDTGPDEKEREKITFLEHKVSIGGEYLTWPNNGVRWEQAFGTSTGEVSTSIPSYDPADDKKFQVFEDINVGMVIPTIEHSITWHYVELPPWTGMRNCVGKVNAEKFGRVDPECMLFLGAEASRGYSNFGNVGWTVELRLSEKCMNYPTTKTVTKNGKRVQVKEVPQGWNHFLRPGTGKFERMVRRDGTGVYQSAKFRQLFGGRP